MRLILLFPALLIPARLGSTLLRPRRIRLALTAGGRRIRARHHVFPERATVVLREPDRSIVVCDIATVIEIAIIRVVRGVRIGVVTGRDIIAVDIIGFDISESESTAGVLVLRLAASSAPDDVGDEEDQPDQTHHDAGDRQPQCAGDQPDDKQDETDKGGSQRQGQHVIDLR
ncbi:hypothetical protein ACPXB3_06470 [Gordonia sp. DT219]|uniref:hypothetical protein n=1 Tax=Gordonia sp. DT219 TaxID=3416658 RepID=UPI003CF0F00B